MRTIAKGQEPLSLTKHRADCHGDYDNYYPKDELRTALVKEQRGLCCYCMTNVSDDASKMKIEHWKSRSGYPEMELAYKNLLAACLGGSGQPQEMQHCDTLKGRRDLKFNPANPDHRVDQRIRFELNGAITSNDDEFNVQLSEVLGLNLPVLKNRRKGVLDGMLKWWRDEKSRLHGPVPRERLERERSRRLGHGDEILAFSNAIEVWWLGQRLSRPSA